MSWSPDSTLIDEESLLRELKDLAKALDAKRDEWLAKSSTAMSKLDAGYIAALIIGLEMFGDFLDTYRTRTNALHAKGYNRADAQLASLFYSLTTFQTTLHQWYRQTLYQQTREQVEKIRRDAYQSSRDIQDGINKRWSADFFRTCIHCQYWLGEKYPYLEICPRCGRLLHK